MALALPFIALTIFLLVFMCNHADCFDYLDPNGNITVTFDIHKWTTDGYMARVTIQNYYQYRHVEKPGWTLGWTWAMGEIIWLMAGAFATQQGNCSEFKYQMIPHSCKKDPVIADLMPDAKAENRSENCCNGGLLSAWAIDPPKSFSNFEMVVGNLPGNSSGYLPLNLAFMAPGPGYTCGSFEDSEPTVYQDINGRREMQVFRTWKATCTYSSFIANKSPNCCVSLSTFYSSTITSCPLCSCACRLANDNTATSCIGEGYSMLSPDDLKLDNILQCTDHMCPIRVHWHLKNNYNDYWRVKLTISNYNYGTNYTNWNVLVQHPGFSMSPTTYSFNSTLLPTFGFAGDEVALFWGISNYNTELPQISENQVGSVSTEILLGKDDNSFTLQNGWAFPRKVYFNGNKCEMPLPDDFPALPSDSSNLKPNHHLLLLLILLCLNSKSFVAWFLCLF